VADFLIFCSKIQYITKQASNTMSDTQKVFDADIAVDEGPDPMRKYLRTWRFRDGSVGSFVKGYVPCDSDGRSCLAFLASHPFPDFDELIQTLEDPAEWSKRSEEQQAMHIRAMGCLLNSAFDGIGEWQAQCTAKRRPARQPRDILAAAHLLPALLVVLAGAPVAVLPACASLASVANGHEHFLAQLAGALGGLGLSAGLGFRFGLGGCTGRFGHGVTFYSQQLEMLKLALRVVRTPQLSKKDAAVFLLANGRQRTVRFGTASNYVSNARKTARDRAAYIARHRVNENHGDPLTPGALSRWLLWGESRGLARNTAAFRRRFRLR
jgi:hypothetical protein